MTSLLTSPNTRRLLGIVFLVSVTFNSPSKADNPSDSINTIQKVLPDSLSLDGKVVYVDFWASWCAPCKQSFPWMQEIYEKYNQKGFEIVAVSVDKDHKQAMKFLENLNAKFPIVFDSTGSLAKKFGLEVMPSSYLYNSKGQIFYQHQGFQKDDEESIERTISKLLNEKAEK